MAASPRVSMIPKSLIFFQTLRLKIHSCNTMFFPNIKITGTENSKCKIRIFSFSSPRVEVVVEAPVEVKLIHVFEFSVCNF